MNINSIMIHFHAIISTTNYHKFTILFMCFFATKIDVTFTKIDVTFTSVTVYHSQVLPCIINKWYRVTLTSGTV